MIRAILFDLDYTLYDHTQYLQGAFRDIAYGIAQQVGVEAEALHERLQAVWHRRGTDYGFLFHDWLEEAGLFTQERLRESIRLFHAHAPERLAYYEDVEAMLRTLRRRYRLGIVTDGHVGMQRAKVRALGLDALVDVLVFAKEHGPGKPDLRAFEHAVELLGLTPAEVVFVGDHPVKDISAARQVGMRAVRVLQGEFGALDDHEEYAPDHRLMHIASLPAYLDTLTDTTPSV